MRIALCCGAIVAALYVVGFASGTVLRHAVQSAPLLIPVVVGARGSTAARWLAIPMFVFWLLIATLIWLYLLGWARVVTGHFSPIEIAMTIAFGAAAIAGFAVALRTPGGPRIAARAGLVALGAVLQIAAFWLSLQPGLATR